MASRDKETELRIASARRILADCPTDSRSTVTTMASISPEFTPPSSPSPELESPHRNAPAPPPRHPWDAAQHRGGRIVFGDDYSSSDDYDDDDDDHDDNDIDHGGGRIEGRRDDGDHGDHAHGGRGVYGYGGGQGNGDDGGRRDGDAGVAEIDSNNNNYNINNNNDNNDNDNNGYAGPVYGDRFARDIVERGDTVDAAGDEGYGFAPVRGAGDDASGAPASTENNSHRDALERFRRQLDEHKRAAQSGARDVAPARTAGGSADYSDDALDNLDDLPEMRRLRELVGAMDKPSVDPEREKDVELMRERLAAKQARLRARGQGAGHDPADYGEFPAFGDALDPHGSGDGAGRIPRRLSISDADTASDNGAPRFVTFGGGGGAGRAFSPDAMSDRTDTTASSAAPPPPTHRAPPPPPPPQAHARPQEHEDDAEHGLQQYMYQEERARLGDKDAADFRYLRDAEDLRALEEEEGGDDGGDDEDGEEGGGYGGAARGRGARGARSRSRRDRDGSEISSSGDRSDKAEKSGPRRGVLKNTPFGAPNFSYHKPRPSDLDANDDLIAQLRDASEGVGGVGGVGGAGGADGAGRRGPGARGAAVQDLEGLPVHERLIAEGEAREARRRARERLAYDESGDYPFTPKLSAKARKLARKQQAEHARQADPGGGPGVARAAWLAEDLKRREAQKEERLECLRREKEAREREELTFRPRILASTAAIAEPYASRGDVTQRLTKQHREVLQAREAKRREAEAREAETATFKPKISKKARKLTRTLDDMEKWRRDRDRRREEKREEQERAEEASLTFRPGISVTTEKIVARMDRPERVEDSLFARHEHAQRRREEKLRRLEDEQREAMRPKPSAHSANYVRRGDITQRTYPLYATEGIEQSRARAGSDDDGDPDASSARGAVDPDATFKPYINPMSRSIVRDQPIEDSLLQRHKETVARRIEKAREREEALERAKSGKKMNAVSQVLAKVIEERTGESARDRIVKDTTEKRELARVEAERRELAACTFRPRRETKDSTIAPKPPGESAGAENPASVDEKFDRLYRRANAIKQSREDRRTEKERAELAECTFKPALPSASRKMAERLNASASSRAGGGDDAGDTMANLAERTYDWQRRRDAWREAERAKKEMEALKECSFAPNTHARAGPSSGPGPGAAKAPGSAAPGRRTQGATAFDQAGHVTPKHGGAHTRTTRAWEARTSTPSRNAGKGKGKGKGKGGGKGKGSATPTGPMTPLQLALLRNSMAKEQGLDPYAR